MAVFAVTNWCNFYTFGHVHTHVYISKNIKPKCLKYMLNVYMAKYMANSTLCRNYWLLQRKYVFSSSAILPEEAQAL